MKKYLKLACGWGSAFLPMLVFAQDFNQLTTNIQTVINRAIPILIALATVVFIWGIVQMITAAGDEEARTKGRQHMIWGIIGIAAIVGLWGLVNVVITAFGLTGSQPTLPQIRF